MSIEDKKQQAIWQAKLDIQNSIADNYDRLQKVLEAKPSTEAEIASVEFLNELENMIANKNLRTKEANYIYEVARYAFLIGYAVCKIK